MLKRGEKIHDLPGLLEALCCDNFPGGVDRDVHLVFVWDPFPNKDPEVRVLFKESGVSGPDWTFPFSRECLAEALRNGFVEASGEYAVKPYLFVLSQKGREERDRMLKSKIVA